MAGRRATRRDVIGGAAAAIAAGIATLSAASAQQTSPPKAPATTTPPPARRGKPPGKLLRTYHRPIVVGLNAQPGEPTYQSIADIPKILKDKYDIVMEFQIHPGSTLGTDLSQLEAVQAGYLDITSNTTSQFSVFDDSFAFVDLPHLISSWDTALRLFRSPLWQQQAAAFEKVVPVKVLPPATAGGFRRVANSKRRATVPADLKGLKLRATRSPIEQALIRQWGAEPVALPWVETYASLAQGAIDGIHVQPIWMSRFKMHEQIKFVTDVVSLFTVQLQVMNTKTWEEMPPEIQDPFLRAAQEAADRANTRDRAMETAALDELKKAGVEVYTPTADEAAQWRAAGDKVLTALGAQIDKKIVDGVTALARGA
ncbi:MAG: TRAP transporter substrate-binding protein [Alphaproteobacteria bacterium]|nr:TRAP transporter substrate-binding protein [Alphaproteobacteria bacterium]